MLRITTLKKNCLIPPFDTKIQFFLMFFIFFSLIFSLQVKDKNSKSEINAQKKQILEQNLLNLQKINLFANNQEGTQTSSPAPTSTPKISPKHDDDDDDDDDAGDIKPKPQPTDQIIGRTLAGIQVTTMTYVGFVIIAAIILLFFGWKKCYKSATNDVVIHDDIVLAENMKEPLNQDNIEIRIEESDSYSDKQEDKKEDNNANQQDNAELPNPFSHPPPV